MTKKTHKNYIVLTASCRMPANCWGRYGKVAVVELEDDFLGIPKMISERAKGVKRIVTFEDRLFNGTTTRCAFSQALARAGELVEELNEK
jgi:hypothetical protein